jgi:hypothetical protein
VKGYTIDAGGELGRFAENVQVEGRLDKDGMNKMIESEHVTRCSTTSYALASYFCSGAVADKLTNTPRYTLLEFVQHLQEVHVHQSSSSSDFPHPSVLCHFDIGVIGTGRSGDLLGHVFTIRALPNGRFHWYQSFISHYSLKTWLSKDKYDLNLRMLSERLAHLADLEKTVVWNQIVENAYKALFDVSIRQQYRKHQSFLGKVRSTRIVNDFDLMAMDDYEVDEVILSSDSELGVPPILGSSLSNNPYIRTSWTIVCEYPSKDSSEDIVL